MAPDTVAAPQVLDWLMAGDPAVRWQVMADLIDAPDEQVATERAKVATQGWGKRLLDLQEAGQWAGGACFPDRGWRPEGPLVGDPEAQPWLATLPTLRLLREFGLDPADPMIRPVIAGVRDNSRWEYNDELFFYGEVEPCINGGAVAIGAYFGPADGAHPIRGVDVDGIVERLLAEQLDDGGWNCEAENGATVSSFHSTINVLDGLAEYDVEDAYFDVSEARARGEEYLLSRKLFRSKRSGEVIDPEWLQFSFPSQWYYDVLRGLDYLRATGAEPDPRIAEAVQVVRDKQQPDGRWLAENTHPGLQWFELEDGDGAPSRWNTLRALRVLRWADQQE